MPDLDSLLAMQYLRSSQHHRATIGTQQRPHISPAPSFKKYPDAPLFSLPTNWSLDEARITPLLQGRRSQRKFGTTPLPFADLSFMLWAMQGVTGKAGNFLFRTVPSAGALYPVETYCVAERVEGLPPGLYHLDVERFQLEQLQRNSCADDLAMACLGQQFINQAAVTFIWTAVVRRNLQKYGNRGLRYILLDAGHICQNALIAAEATGCGGCPVAAFFDEEINAILGIDGQEETALYLASVGIKDNIR